MTRASLRLDSARVAVRRISQELEESSKNLASTSAERDNLKRRVFQMAAIDKEMEELRARASAVEGLQQQITEQEQKLASMTDNYKKVDDHTTHTNGSNNLTGHVCL
jgi:flagellar biosynthesis chaperone FliJ